MSDGMMNVRQCKHCLYLFGHPPMRGRPPHACRVCRRETNSLSGLRMRYLKGYPMAVLDERPRD